MATRSPASPTAGPQNEQMRRLNDSLVSGSFSRQEYDELLPFLASSAEDDERQRADAAYAASLATADQRGARCGVPPPREPASASPPSNVTFANQPQETAAQRPAPRTTGLQLRCPACGTANDTSLVSRCQVCESRLTIGDRVSSSRGAVNGAAYNYSSSANADASAALRRGLDWTPRGVFSSAADGRVRIHDGVFSCAMQTTQTLATADGDTCEVFVLCCNWQPVESTTPATWYVSQRFSQFERLHKALRRRLPRAAANAMPPFPAKFHLTRRLEKRKQALATYMPRLLDMCAHLPQAQTAPELDEFLDITHQVQLFRRHQPAAATAAAAATNVVSRASESTAATSTSSSPFPAFTGRVGASATPTAAPMDEQELAQAEGAVRLLADAVRRARGDVRGDATVQHHLDVCVQLAPGLQRSADVDDPFVDAELIPRALQCQEDLQQAVALYNDALLAVSAVPPTPSQLERQQASQTEPEEEPEGSRHVRFQTPQSEPQQQQSQQPQQVPGLHVRNVVPASAA